jgi:hypothetical protein
MAGGWAKQGQQFGRASPFIFMGLAGWVTFRLPRGSRLRNRLIGTRLILIQLHNPGSLRLLAGQFNQSSFFGGLRVIDSDGPAFAFAPGVAGVAPRPCPLVAIARPVQDFANRFFIVLQL